ncbi:GGDEF domain-containing protein [Alteromonas oceani]|uniref:diguanylate cyclase n=1 Tax=Alteromonas oceani TaxID=2071609 RepID=A0ABV7JZM8_9ALTE|nr:GGDEF domain-containing protein [Alteromonas oceani]
MFKAKVFACCFLLLTLPPVQAAEAEPSLYQYSGLFQYRNKDTAEFIDAARQTDLLTANTPVARVFRYIYVQGQPDLAQYTPWQSIESPSEADWQTLKATDEIYYAAARSLMTGFIEQDEAKLKALKQELLITGNKVAVAQVASMLAVLYLDFKQDSLNALEELMYALPEIQVNNGNDMYGLLFDKEFVLFHLFAILYDLGAYESSYQYGKAYFDLASKTSPQMMHSSDYFLMVQLASHLGKYNEALDYADELQIVAQQEHPSAQLYALLAKVSVYARRGEPGDLQQAFELLGMAKLSSKPKDWDVVDEARMLAVNTMEAGLRRDMPAAKALLTQLKQVMAENKRHFNLTDFKHVTELERFLAEFNSDTELAIKASYQLVRQERDKLLNALNNRLDKLSRGMQADIELVNFEKLKANNIAQQQAIETANLKTIIVLLVALLVGTLAAWLFVQRRRIHQLAYIDPLTNAPNRRFMFNLLTKVFTKARKGNCIALLDIDHFKKVNDTYGHQTGDEVLVKCSQLIRQRLRSTDQYCRYGGEEFLLLLKDTTVHQAQEVIDDIRSALHAVTSWQSTEEEFAVSFSCGLVELSTYEDIDKAIAHCDTLLYTAKNQGRGRTILPQGAMQPV